MTEQLIWPLPRVMLWYKFTNRKKAIFSLIGQALNLAALDEAKHVWSVFRVKKKSLVALHSSLASLLAICITKLNIRTSPSSSIVDSTVEHAVRN